MKLWQATSKHEGREYPFAMQPCSLLPQRNGTIPGVKPEVSGLLAAPGDSPKGRFRL